MSFRLSLVKYVQIMIVYLPQWCSHQVSCYYVSINMGVLQDLATYSNVLARFLFLSPEFLRFFSPQVSFVHCHVHKR